MAQTPELLSSQTEVVVRSTNMHVVGEHITVGNRMCRVTAVRFNVPVPGLTTLTCSTDLRNYNSITWSTGGNLTDTAFRGTLDVCSACPLALICMYDVPDRHIPLYVCTACKRKYGIATHKLNNGDSELRTHYINDACPIDTCNDLECYQCRQRKKIAQPRTKKKNMYKRLPASVARKKGRR